MEGKALRNHCRVQNIALKSPMILYSRKKAQPQKTSNHIMTKQWECFSSFTCFFFYFLMFRSCAVMSLLSFEQRTRSAAMWQGWLMIIGLKTLPNSWTKQQNEHRHWLSKSQKYRWHDAAFIFFNPSSSEKKKTPCRTLKEAHHNLH